MQVEYSIRSVDFTVETTGKRMARVEVTWTKDITYDRKKGESQPSSTERVSAIFPVLNMWIDPYSGYVIEASFAGIASISKHKKLIEILSEKKCIAAKSVNRNSMQISMNPANYMHNKKPVKIFRFGVNPSNRFSAYTGDSGSYTIYDTQADAINCILADMSSSDTTVSGADRVDWNRCDRFLDRFRCEYIYPFIGEGDPMVLAFDDVVRQVSRRKRWRSDIDNASDFLDEIQHEISA